MNLLDVKNLKKYFPLFSGLFRKQTAVFKAVDDVSFSIKKGEVFGLVGESGSGKSTTAKATMRLLEPTYGQISFCGEDFLNASKQRVKALRKDMQMIFQDPFSSLNPRKTVAESIGEGLLYHSIASSEKEKNFLVEQTLEQVGLPSTALSQYPHEFSGGQQQRICIGRAIALKPRLIVCDEAVSALDVSIQAQILNLLLELKSRLSLSYLFISHDLSVVRHICDRVAVMQKGKIVEVNTTEKLFEDPQHEYTQELLRSIPIEHPKDRASKKSAYDVYVERDTTS